MAAIINPTLRWNGHCGHSLKGDVRVCPFVPGPGPDVADICPFCPFCRARDQQPLKTPYQSSACDEVAGPGALPLAGPGAVHSRPVARICGASCATERTRVVGKPEFLTNGLSVHWVIGQPSELFSA